MMVREVNRRGHMRADALVWEVEVLNEGSVAGDTVYEVAPVSGEGRKWVPASRVRFNDEEG